jgi:hypothetical protein
MFQLFVPFSSMDVTQRGYRASNTKRPRTFPISVSRQFQSLIRKRGRGAVRHIHKIRNSYVGHTSIRRKRKKKEREKQKKNEKNKTTTKTKQKTE